MGLYFGILKQDISYNKVEKRMTDLGIRVFKYYPKLRIVKFESDKKISETELDFFIAIEEETDFISI